MSKVQAAALVTLFVLATALPNSSAVVANDNVARGQACEVISSTHAFFGEDGSSTIRAHENQPCINLWHWDKNSVLNWFKISSRPSHGLAGTYMMTGFGYKPAKDFTGMDSFVITYDGYGKFHSGTTHFNVSVEVVP